MDWVLLVIMALFATWGGGVWTGHLAGGAIHILLVVAIVMVISRIVES